MKILDNFNKELEQEEIDLTKGRLVSDKLFIEHHEAISASEEEGYFTPVKFYFFDGSSYTVTDKQDKHIGEEGVFIGQTEEERSKEVIGTDWDYVVTQQAQRAIPAWDEYEDIQRYILYSEEELKKIEEQKELERQREEAEQQARDFLLQIPTILEEKDRKIQEYSDIINQQQTDINDIILTLSELIGVGDSEEEPTITVEESEEDEEQPGAEEVVAEESADTEETIVEEPVADTEDHSEKESDNQESEPIEEDTPIAKEPTDKNEESPVEGPLVVEDEPVKKE